MRFEVQTNRREQMIEITHQVEEVAASSGVVNGRMTLFCQHTTAAITVNESADPDVRTDILAGLARIIPESGAWLHAEGNSDAHLKASLIGASLDIPIIGGKMALGTWQGVFLCEFDGPRRRTIVGSIIGD